MLLGHTSIHQTAGNLQTGFTILPICQSAPTGRQPGFLLPNHTTPATSLLCHKCPAFTWLHAPMSSGLSRIKHEASCTSSQHVRLHCCVFGFGLLRISQLSYKSAACKQMLWTHKLIFCLLLVTCRGFDKNDGLACTICSNLPPLVFTSRLM